jgi:hypothetical protein
MVTSKAADGDQLKLADGVEAVPVSEYSKAGRVPVSDPAKLQPAGVVEEGELP